MSVRWTWRGLQPMPDDLTVVLRLDHDASTRFRSQSWPVGGPFTTSWWAHGERVDQRVVLRLPTDLPPGSYHVDVVVRPTRSLRPLKLTGVTPPESGRHTARLATLTVTP